MKPNLPYCTTKQATATGVYSVYPILSGGDWSAVEQLKRMNRRTRNETACPVTSTTLCGDQGSAASS
jgi:hypothetical protein